MRASPGQKPPSRATRFVLIVFGVTAVVLGAIGIVVPVLPTTPFFLLAGVLFARSSQRLYRWLLGHRLFGGYIRNYIHHRAIGLRVKIVTLAMLWGTILLSAYLMRGIVWVQLLLLAVAVGVTLHVSLLRTLRGRDRDAP